MAFASRVLQASEGFSHILPWRWVFPIDTKQAVLLCLSHRVADTVVARLVRTQQPTANTQGPRRGRPIPPPFLTFPRDVLRQMAETFQREYRLPFSLDVFV